MNTQLDLPYERIAKTSRRSSIISLFGLIIVLTALSYSAYKLAELSREVHRRTTELASIRKEINEAQREIDSVRIQLQASREAVAFVTQGINLYHQGSYSQAVIAYNEALRLDPQNPYIVNLKGYSLFKANRLEEAVKILEYSVEIDPSYAWGFFDLARVLCANKEFDKAREAAMKAVKLRPDLRRIMLSDGEFTRLCKPILNSIKAQ